jgi:hypothetical protein
MRPMGTSREAMSPVLSPVAVFPGARRHVTMVCRIGEGAVV